MKESSNAVESIQRGGGFFSDEFKHRLIAEVSHPGASLSRVARKHGVGISTLSNWRKQYQRQTDTVELIPIAVSPPSTLSRPPDELTSKCSTCFSEQTAPGLLEITLERATLLEGLEWKQPKRSRSALSVRQIQQNQAGTIQEAACMAPARRKIYDTHLRHPSPNSQEALKRIGELYDIEAQIRGQSVESRLKVRQEKSGPLLEELGEWLRERVRTLSQHAELAKAFNYLLNHWSALNVFCHNGLVEIDNNIAENALRAVALGRKNYRFMGSDRGGEFAANLYSLIGTCKLNGIEPEAY